MSNDYTLNFDLISYHHLDQFALLACQDYNLGNNCNWLFEFRKGLEGLYARLLGVQIHYYKIHSWELVESVVLSGIPHDMINPRLYRLIEYHLSSVLFNMDSAIECIVFTLNALGYAANPKRFKDPTNEKELKKISIYNILGVGQNLVPGYGNHFRSLKTYWDDNRYLIQKIFLEHQVSKHRSATFKGGKRRQDTPPDFFKKLGIDEYKKSEIPLPPFADIILSLQQKKPRGEQELTNEEEITRLENLADKFQTFINISGIKALEDAKNTIKLNSYELK